MGGWTRLREKMRQGSGVSREGLHNGFRPTSNERCTKSFEEATQFMHVLKHSHTSVKNLQKAATGLMFTTQEALNTPDPTPYDRDPHTGRVRPRAVQSDLVPAPSQEVDVNALPAIMDNTSNKLEQEVMAPMRLWLSNYKDVKAKMTLVEGLRLDYDSARRNYNRLEVDRVRQQQNRDSVNHKLQTKLTYAKGKLDDRRDKWAHYEAALYEQLTQLITEAGLLRNLLAKTYSISTGAFDAATVPASEKHSPVQSVGTAYEGSLTGTQPNTPLVVHTGVGASSPVQHTGSEYPAAPSHEVSRMEKVAGAEHSSLHAVEA